MNNIFPKLLGNNAIKDLCGADIRNSKHSHAYIIDGPDGSGKHTAALQIAMAILCHNKGKDGFDLPCGICPSCAKIAAGYSTDVQFVNRGNNATFQVDVIRNMLSGIGYLPDDGDYKIYIIEEADKMTAQAQNSLLLSLEEPPAHVVFILLTTDSGALLETIRSRAHTLKTEMLSASFILETLHKMRSEGTISERDENKLQTAASAASGSLGSAILLCSKSESSPVLKYREIAEQLVYALIFAGSAEAVNFCRTIDSKRTECEDILFYAMSAVRDYIALKNGNHSTLFYTDTEKAHAEAVKTTLPRLLGVYRLLEAAQDDICRKNASISTVFCTLAANAWKENR